MYSIRRNVRVILTLLYVTTWCGVIVAQDHPCARTCILDEDPLDCDYTFAIENYRTMSKACYSCPTTEEDCSREDCIPADGSGRDIITVNRLLPGPKIEVCQGDNINVAVTNSLFSDSTTIHWHGQFQVDTPYMDGVPFITQCPISPLSTFTYRFSAQQAGTHFYHSHIAAQRGDGVFGALVVRQPEELNSHSDLYDQDLSSHIIFIHDWHREVGLTTFLSDIHAGGDGLASSILVNGKGRLVEFTDDDGTTVYTPVERFYVEQQQRYRFRVVNNGVIACPIQLSIDGHTLTVISADANDIEPVEVASFVSYPGERFDFVLNADQDVDLYWMRLRGLEDCTTNSIHQVAVLHYEGASEDEYPSGSTDYEDSAREGLQINAPGVGLESEDADAVSVATLRSVEDIDPLLTETPDLRYVVPISVHGLDHPVFHKPGAYGYNEVEWGQLPTPQLGYANMQLLPYPLLTQRDSIPENAFCNSSTIAASCEDEFCYCTHVVQIPLGSSVEMIFFNEHPVANHPIHIHGLSFRVIGMEALGETLSYDAIDELDENGSLIRNFDNPPLKDTVQVPPGGYTIIRFLATNPGYWYMHCHLEFHTVAVMSMSLKIGEHEDMVPVPTNFPTCGDYDVLNP